METTDIIEATEACAVAQQPPPVPSTGDVWALVIEDMRQRREFGIAKYGVPLQVENGRDHLTDALQEALDLVVYLRAAIEQRKATDLHAALLDVFEALRLSGGRRPDAPYAWDRAQLADEISPLLSERLRRQA